MSRSWRAVCRTGRRVLCRCTEFEPRRPCPCCFVDLDTPEFLPDPALLFYYLRLTVMASKSARSFISASISLMIGDKYSLSCVPVSEGSSPSSPIGTHFMLLCSFCNG